MAKLYIIGEAARLANTTTETLRHYDRIGLIKPSKTNETTNYRYYTDEDIIHLNTINSLRCMDLSLKTIKEILSVKDFNKIVELFKQAENTADQKINDISIAKTKIKTARIFYESKLHSNNVSKESFIQRFKQRVILLSDTLKIPTTDNLFNYHRHYYNQIGFNHKDSFSFDDLAGIYHKKDISSMFAVCNKYQFINAIEILPAGEYLCINCTEKNQIQAKEYLIDEALSKHHIKPKFIVQMIVLCGVLKWNYQIQIYLGNTINL